MLLASDRARAQKTLLWFGIFNALSFTLLTGNLISLYLLRLGAGNTLIGVVASFGFMSFFFMIAGKRLVPSVGVMRLFAWAWLVRYIAIIPILLAPIFIGGPRAAVAFLLVAVGTFGFQAARGVGILANAPMFSGFAGPADRGKLMSTFQISAALVSIVTGSAVAFFLGPEADLARYVLFLSAGIACGLVATGLVFSLPELEHERDHAKASLRATVRQALADTRFRAFVSAFLLVAVASGIGRSFLIVFAKQAYQLSDRSAFLLVAIGSLGNMVAGYLGSILLDRLGAKPIILFSLISFAVSLIPVVILPPMEGVVLFALLGVVFFLATMGYSGAEVANQAYFFGITRNDARLNLGILYYVTLGLGGFLGSFAGGIILDLFQTFLSVQWAFRLFFAAAAVILVGAAVRTWRLESLGAETFRGALEVIFSPRDLRAAGLANRLVRSRSQDEERRTIRDLAQSGSVLPLQEILRRVESPGYALRHEALEALSTLPFTEEVEQTLRSHLSSGEHTTAAQAAWLLGVRGGRNAVPDLRRATESTDRLLAGRAVVALARLGEDLAAARAVALLEATNHGDPGEYGSALHAAVALQIAGEPEHLSSIGKTLMIPGLPAYVVDELVFAVTQIEGMHEWFYPYYAGFTRNDERQDRLHQQLDVRVPEGLRDAVVAVDRRRDAAQCRNALVRYLTERDTPNGTEAAWPTRNDVERMPNRNRTLFCVAAVLYHRAWRASEVNSGVESSSPPS